MRKNLPKELLQTKYRREMWKNAKRVLSKVEKALSIKEAHAIGSFLSKKERPSDVDFMVILKTPEKNKRVKWSLDMVLVPDNKYGKYVQADNEKWCKMRYGKKWAKIKIK